MIIERILDRHTVEPISGYSNAELLAQHQLQRDIMNNHEDYEALRGKANPADLIDATEKRTKKVQSVLGNVGKGNVPKSLTRSLQICPK